MNIITISVAFLPAHAITPAEPGNYESPGRQAWPNAGTFLIENFASSTRAEKCSVLAKIGEDVACINNSNRKGEGGGLEDLREQQN